MDSKPSHTLLTILAIISLAVYLICPILTFNQFLLIPVNLKVTGMNLIENMDNVSAIFDQLGSVGSFCRFAMFLLILPAIGGVIAILGGFTKSCGTQRFGSSLANTGLTCVLLILILTPVLLGANLASEAGASLNGNGILQLAFLFLPCLDIGFWLSLILFSMTSSLAKSNLRISRIPPKTSVTYSAGPTGGYPGSYPPHNPQPTPQQYQQNSGSEDLESNWTQF